MAEPFLVWQRGDVTAVRFLGPKIGLEDRESLYALVDIQGIKKLVLDFNDVKLLTSAPIGMLINLNKKAEAAGGRMALCHLRPDIREILSLCGVESLFAIYDSEDNAIKSFEAA